jgi:hypothetical protein
MRGAAALHQPGDLMPVDVVGAGLSQQPGDAQALELRHAPAVHGRLVMVENIGGGKRFHRSSLQRAVVLDGAGAACSFPFLACQPRAGQGEWASPD